MPTPHWLARRAAMQSTRLLPAQLPAAATANLAALMSRSRASRQAVPGQGAECSARSTCNKRQDCVFSDKHKRLLQSTSVIHPHSPSLRLSTRVALVCCLVGARFTEEQGHAAAGQQGYRTMYKTYKCLYFQRCDLQMSIFPTLSKLTQTLELPATFLDTRMGIG